MDDATNEHYAMFFGEEEGTASSFRGVREVIERRGLFASLYPDRGSPYWHKPEAGGKVDKVNLTQSGRAMAQLGIERIPAYSPEARGRSERMFRTHLDRLPKELSAAGIADMAAANRYLAEVDLPAFNAEFRQPPMEEGSAFVPWIGGELDDLLCEQPDRVVGKDRCVAFEGLKLQIPADRPRMHYVKVKGRVHRYPDGRLAVSSMAPVSCPLRCPGSVGTAQSGGRCVGPPRATARGKFASGYALRNLPARLSIADRLCATKPGSSICCQHEKPRPLGGRGLAPAWRRPSGGEITGGKIPVHEVPEGFHVLGARVPVIDVIGMLPDVTGQDGRLACG
jgi:hypothetical protein